MSDRVFMRHIRPLCAKGVRAWYAAHDLDYRQLVLEGTPVDVLEATGDPFALEACRKARAEGNEE